jgi:hypothetical protein
MDREPYEELDNMTVEYIQGTCEKGKVDPTTQN